MSQKNFKVIESTVDRYLVPVNNFGGVALKTVKPERRRMIQVSETIEEARKILFDSPGKPYMILYPKGMEAY